jgi:hypothetical protein
VVETTIDDIHAAMNRASSPLTILSKHIWIGSMRTTSRAKLNCIITLNPGALEEAE